MDYPRDNVFTFLFSTYKKTAGIVFVAVLVLAIPITIGILSNQQDIRQRASGGDFQVQNATTSLRAFTSSSRHRANFGGLTQADAVCQQLATAANLGGIWKAWLSDSSTNAKDRISDGKYVRLDNSTIANSKADLTDGSLSNSLGRDERGRRIEDQESVWTGTKRDGTKHEATCSNWTAGNSTGRRGSATQRDEDWTDDGSQSCDRSLRIYCFEQAIAATLTPTLSATPSATTTPTPTSGPLTIEQKLFDFNDDGKIDEKDLNILYGGFAKRTGD